MSAVLRLLKEASQSCEATRRFSQELQNAQGIEQAVRAFMEAVGGWDNDRERSPVHTWPDSPGEELVDRCLHSAEMDIRMATIAIQEARAAAYERQKRGVE